jgi:FKBP-type peptidyl-prolyl cis-trans isomerase (trigger factor)
MNVKQDKLTELTSQLTIDVVEQDYQGQVKKALTSYQQKANIPGFRPGKVPFGMIQKMYGKAVLIDEVNKLLSDTLNKHIEDNKLDVLGQPLPTDDNDTIDFDLSKDFTFKFEIAVAPEFELDLSKCKVTDYQITVGDTMVQKSVDSLLERFKEEDGKPAELNQDLFDKVYGKDAVKSEKELRERIRKDGEKMYQQQADRRFTQDAIEAVVEGTKFELPDEFLKRWLLVANSDKNLTKEQIELDYDRYRNMLKWQLIEAKIIKSNDIKVNRDDVKEYYINNVVSQYFPIPEDEEGRKRIEQFAETMMQNHEETKQVYDMVYDLKVSNVLRSEMKVSNKKIDFDDYVEMLKEEHDAGKAAEEKKKKPRKPRAKKTEDTEE